MWEWTVKKSEHWRIDSFELWCCRTLASPLDCKEIQPVYPKGDQSWVFIGRTDAETPTLWPPYTKNWLIGTDLMLGEIEGERRRGLQNYRGWDVWMASLTQWTWVWVNPGSWWWTGRPGMLQSMGSQRVGHDWVTELNWTELWKTIWRFLNKTKIKQRSFCSFWDCIQVLYFGLFCWLW